MQGIAWLGDPYIGRTIFPLPLPPSNGQYLLLPEVNQQPCSTTTGVGDSAGEAHRDTGIV